MDEKLNAILQRIDSRHLAKLWGFYRDYFKNDEECLCFIFDSIHREPIHNPQETLAKSYRSFSDDDSDQDDRLLVPRRMMNCVQRMVSAARDMEQIRQGMDIFKIVFLVTCVETLQKLSGHDGKKKDMLFDFFLTYTSENDKSFIRAHFAHGTWGLYDDEDSFEQFVGVLNEYRNCAAHEGEYWDYCFNNDSEQKPVSIFVKIDLERYSSKNKKVIVFETTLSYRRFEAIFIRTCIEFIRRYVAGQEEKQNADA